MDGWMWVDRCLDGYIGEQIDWCKNEWVDGFYKHTQSPQHKHIHRKRKSVCKGKWPIIDSHLLNANCFSIYILNVLNICGGLWSSTAQSTYTYTQTHTHIKRKMKSSSCIVTALQLYVSWWILMNDEGFQKMKRTWFVEELEEDHNNSSTYQLCHRVL